MKKLYYLLTALVLTALTGYGETISRVNLISDRAAARLLDQGTWGATPTSIAYTQTLGVAGWLNQEFSAALSDLPDQPVLGADGKPNRDLRPVQSAFFANALYR